MNDEFTQMLVAAPGATDRPTLAAFLTSLRPTWARAAACRGHDLDLWFPTRGKSSWPARRICGCCPVQDECAAWAEEHDELGVWGRLTEADRRARRPARRPGRPRRDVSSAFRQHDTPGAAGADVA